MNKEIYEHSNTSSVNGGIIYNVTTQVERHIANDSLQWLMEEHIPDIIANGCFTNAVMMRLMEVVKTQGPTYAIQYHADRKAHYKCYILKPLLKR